MAEYALIAPNNTINRRASNVDPNVQTRAGWRWLPIERAGDGAFDPVTQVKTGPVTTIEQNRVLDTFTIRSKTAEEIDADKTAAVDSVNGSAYPVIFRALFNLNNRVRVLEGQSHLTQAQFKAALRALI